MEALVHLVDIGNFLKPLDICINWSYRIVMEFMIQGDKEKLDEKGDLKQKELFDRDWVNFNASQVGF